MPDDPKSPVPSPDLPSPDPLPDLLPSPEKSPTTEASTSIPTQSPPPASSSPASLADDELIADKKRLVAAFDQIVEPLNQILGLIRHAWRGGVIMLAFMALMVAVQVHTTLRMAAVQEQLAEVVAAQKTLQQTTTQVADKQTATQNALNQQSQITIEPVEGPDGSPTAIVVVKPPPASSQLPAIPLPLALPTVATSFSVQTPKPLKQSGMTPGRQPRPASSASASSTANAYVPPPAPAPPDIKFE
jgi:hypothetical protein